MYVLVHVEHWIPLDWDHDHQISLDFYMRLVMLTSIDFVVEYCEMGMVRSLGDVD
jgi:hypothetical protein